MCGLSVYPLEDLRCGQELFIKHILLRYERRCQSPSELWTFSATICLATRLILALEVVSFMTSE